jgi:hypothetical protein
MAFLLSALPYYDEITKIVAPGVSEQAYPYQIIIWVSITPVEQFDLPPTSLRFPAILDTGLNDNFAIAPVHLRAWAGIHWKSLPEVGVARYYGNIRVPTRRAYVWLHPNQSGWRDWVNPNCSPFRIELSDGITVYGNGEEVGSDARTKTLLAPRLPIIGLRALTEVESQLHIDCARRLISLYIPD